MAQWIETHLHRYFDFAAMSPALVSLILLLCSALSSMLADRALPRVKCCVSFTDLSLVVCLAWYVVLVGGGLFADRPLLANTWATFERSARRRTQTSTPWSRRRSRQSTTLPAVGHRLVRWAPSKRGQGRLYCFVCVPRYTAGVAEGARHRRAHRPRVHLARAVSVNGLCCANGCCKRAPTRVAPSSADPNERAPTLFDETAEFDDEDLDDDDYYVID